MDSSLKASYRDVQRPLHAALAEKVASLARELVEREEIPVAQIQSRAKSVDSFLAKARRQACRDPLGDIKDLAGVRVITYYNDDVSRVAELLRSEFHVDDQHSSDKLDQLDVDEFGYRSFHLVCAFAEPRSSLPEYSDYLGLWVEIQVRSVLQHAWAAISHRLDYKSVSQAPKELRRQLFRLSALLEIADDEFAVFRDRSRRIIADYRDGVDRGDLEIPLDWDSLDQFTREGMDLDEWRNIGLAAGMEKGWGDEDEAERDFSLGQLLSVLQALDVRSIAEFESLVEKHKAESSHVLSRFVLALSKRGQSFNSVPLDVLTVLLSLGEDLPERHQWEFEDGVNATLGELSKRQ